MLPTQYQEYIHLSRYARWDNKEQRRETWEETVDRYITFFAEKYPMIPADQWERAGTHIVNLEVMPSMRCLMTAGPALARDNVAGFNCSFVPIDSVRAFDELMYTLMCGTGVGFSVERTNTNKLPPISEQFAETETTITVTDSKLGWCKSLRSLLHLLYGGQVPSIDYRRIRPAGEVLKTFGGRASGPDPLRNLFEFTINIFRGAAGRRLTSLECHDIVCKIAEIVVVGGVRRSALISLSDLEDERMRNCKSGAWWEENVQRALANNSAVYLENPSMEVFFKEWHSLYESKSGERGIFNRDASIQQTKRFNRRDSDQEFGTNPCSEIILRPRQFCNLSEVVVRAEDSLERMAEKVKMATFFGTLQSGLTDFRYLSSQWKKNTEEECLLGVSLTGIMDNKFMSDITDPKLPEHLQNLRQIAVEENEKWADIIGVNHSAAITCVKPSGTVSQLVDSASGIHGRHSQYYVRTVRADKKDPLAQFMVAKGFPVEDDVTKPEYNYVFSFPVKTPQGARMRDDYTALEQFKLWRIYQEHWCEHKPSVTISVKEEEWLEIGNAVYQHFSECSGVSFLPHSEHTYAQAPYQECDEAAYNELLDKMPQLIDWSELSDFEKSDHTTATQELACVAGSCEI